MTVTLENTSKQILVINLDHEDLLNAPGEFGAQEIKRVTVDHLASGALIPRSSKRKVPASLTILAGEQREGLPDAILKVPQVVNAQRAGVLRIVEQEPAQRTDDPNLITDRKEPGK